MVMDPEKRAKLERKGILVLKIENQNRKIEFELDYLSSLSLKDRFAMMFAKSQELKTNLENNGHRKSPSVIKRT
jgi:hypothetical protein